MVYQISSTTYGNLLAIVEGANTYNLSDHNRAPLDVAFDRIEVSRRTAKGTRRRYFVADKRTFSVAWENLPHDNTQSVDGGVGAEELEALYLDVANVGVVQLEVAKRDLTTESIDVHIVSFNKSLNRRFINGHYYDVSMEFEEV